MNTIKSIAKLNQKEMEKGITMDGSWHNDVL
jgi:hypothetical protein